MPVKWINPNAGEAQIPQIPQELTDAALAEILGLGTNDDAVKAMFAPQTPHTSKGGAFFGGIGDMVNKIFALRTYKKQGEAAMELAKLFRPKQQEPVEPFSIQSPQENPQFDGDLYDRF
jgi:hypothetical protein